MKKIIIVLACLVPALLFAQENKGVQFEKGSWSAILQKAKTSNKYIFVDCYATWCGPCKAMDADVFTNQEVAETLKKDFIAVKFQFDQTKDDDESTRRRYDAVEQLKTRYSITVFPTMLFFDSHGELISKEIGQRNAVDFLSLVKRSLNPINQYAVLIAAYKAGHKNYDQLPKLIKLAKNANDEEMSLAIAKDYAYNYLLKLKRDSLYTKENLDFLFAYCKPKNKKIFNVFFQQQALVDSVYHKSGKAKEVATIGYQWGAIYGELFKGVKTRFIISLPKKEYHLG